MQRQPVSLGLGRRVPTPELQGRGSGRLVEAVYDVSRRTTVDFISDQDGA